MPKPFIQLNAAEFSGLLNPIKLIRKIDSIHLTSSWRPAQHQFRGQESLDELHDFHVLENGDTDLPQHLTIDPCGSLWTGRNWNIPPLSARGFSGNHQSGPLLITLIGDFSSGADQVTQEQREALVTICLALCSHFSINPSAIHLLGDFVKLEGSNDAALRELVTDPKWLGTATPAPKTSAQKKPATDPARLNTLGRVFSLLTATPGAGLVQRVLDESSRSSESIDYSARSLQRWLGESVPSDDQLQKMKPYLLNFKKGKFSNSGRIQSSRADVDALFDEYLPNALKHRHPTQPLPLVLFAHGGLVPEKGALESAATHIPWWISNGAFPLYFIWETGIWTTLGNLLEAEIGRYKKFIPWFRESDSRGVTDWISDPAVELIARSIQGKRIWSDMKEAAEKTFSAGGDGLYFIEKLVAFLAAHSDKISLNLIGHSAGSIWHAYLLAALLKERPEAKIQTLSLLAPAMRSDLFKSHFMGASGSAIEELTIFTMDDTRERADHCEHVYQKSLLYLIHHSLENDQKASILGMDVCLRADRELAKHFGLQGSAATSEREVVFSSESNRNYNPRSSSSSLSHGGFDDDPDTLGSIARRILDRQDIVGFPASQKRSSSDPADALDEDQQEILTLLLGSQKQPGKISRPAATSKSASSHHGKKPGHYALCIGIDQYPDPRARLAGCVADARLWTKTFTERGFEVITCLDASATRDGIVQAITSLFRSAKSGDVIAIQFAGHGTEVEDLNGDEQDGDAIDEAFCCYDYASGNLLIDDDLGQLISDAPDGLSITFFMDCCHSGTNTRFGGPLTSSAKETGVTNRHLALRADEIANYKGKRGQSTTTRNSAAHSGNEYLDARETLFSACQPRQLAGEQNGHGLFTLAAVKALTESPLGTSNEKLHQRITALMAMHPNQNPGLHCDPSLHTRPFLT